MTDSVIKVEHLSKQYRIGAREGYRTFRETLVDAVKAPLQGLGSLFTRHSSLVTRHSETIWALKDVSFEVKKGEVVGIIGRNGAGKSTLLKILSRITEPTEGRVELRGRVGSLLEVGTGFHPELTGHENIYLYGAILGMDRWEVTRKFDEIVAFAELERFIDTPVKKYSSGMYMRLAFAVAAHLEPEILLVDEVLAVGDVAFQKKCLGKMGDVAGQGRTVLFVSHNMGAIMDLCGHSLLLDVGRMVLNGLTTDVVSEYLNATIPENAEVFLEAVPSNAHFTKIAILGEEDMPTRTISVSSRFTILFEYKLLQSISGLDVSFTLYNRHGSSVFYSETSESNINDIEKVHSPGSYAARVQVPAHFLAPGAYSITAGLHKPNIQLFDYRHNVIGFSIAETGSKSYRYAGQDIGSILVNLEWQVIRKAPLT